MSDGDQQPLLLSEFKADAEVNLHMHLECIICMQVRSSLLHVYGLFVMSGPTRHL